jgi:uncharacterized lipoprotein YmbA
VTFRTLLTAPLLAVLALCGCGTSPTTNFYTLGQAAAPARNGTPASYSVAIGAVTLPQAVDRPQIVTRTGENQVAFDDFERWAGPLKDEIARAIAGNLTQLLEGASVFSYPQSSSVQADYKVLVDVQRFDSTLGDSSSIEVLWQVRPAKGESRNGRSTVRETAGGAGYEALVSAHSRALAAVSRDIANALRAASASSK